MNTDDASLLQHIIPMNESLLDGGDWYEWRLDNWGTKWDIYDTHCNRIDANTLSMTFYTAWSPPIPVFDKLTDMGFDIHARYLDEGWMYVGEYVDGDDWSTADVENVGEVRPELDDEFDITMTTKEMEHD
jgi:hypothetical protein